MTEPLSTPTVFDVAAARQAIADKGYDWTVAAVPFPPFAFAVSEDAARPYRPKGRRTRRRQRFAGPLPTAIDWRGRVALSPALNQDPGNTCTAFALTGLMADLWEIGHPGAGRRLSAGHLHRCLGGADEGTGQEAEDLLAPLRTRRVAAATAGDYPFDPVLCPTAVGLMSVRDWIELSSPDEAKAALGAGPVYAVMKLYDDFWSGYESGVYRHASGGFLSRHSIAIVGYDDRGQYWIARNSQGPGWGENGFCRIAYGECGIFDYYSGLRLLI